MRGEFGPSLTFQAESGAPILDGMNTVRLLSVGSTSNVTIDGLEIEFGATTGLGGGILSSGTATVERSAVINNAASVNGGGINVQASGTVTLMSSTITGRRRVQPR